MVTKIALFLLIAVAITVPTTYAVLPSSMLPDCTSTAVTASQYKTCYDYLFTVYDSLYLTFEETHQDNLMLKTQLENTTSYYEAEVQLWKAKYTALLLQQGGNSTMQDQIANLTARVDAVETKAATNESLIYIIQNMLRTVQTDIEDIFLKINSVR